MSAYFSQTLGNVLSTPPFVFKNHKDAAQWLILHAPDKSVVALYERKIAEKDIKNIQYFRRNFPYLYILLITQELTIEERILYIRSGVNDTMPPDVSSDTILQFFDFIKKYQADLQSERSPDEIPVTVYKMPVTKRIFDIVFSMLALLGLSPLMLAICIAIRLESKGPVLYKSKRVGSNYKIFDFWKFRSMYIDADQRLKEVESLNQYSDDSKELEHSICLSDNALSELELPVLYDQTYLVSDDYIVPEDEFISLHKKKKDTAFIKIERDPRITRVGHFIRKYSLDELPQLFNILLGDMSIVGNRPLPLYEAELLTQDGSIERFIAPAGLTGLWQVEKRGDSGKLSAEERKQLDIYYAQHCSIWLDLKILFRTFTAFIQKEDV